ncbi:Deoxyribose-phosphate aldolase [Poriferisphaera corsica]|uniref:Deoxyribose-phosphate aldolase n=1 Tax=Poriferisphaera corsica TaxID=2528020 RepID=A0A517YQY8_9BACT|nr:deoxyribose-phosphate aldolase [Poriferisphaera corsica]QDU32650.1 Deoxyribose-phosphate aldolase [Poriferisphaera corsica]
MDLAKYFDHANLRAEASEGDIRQLCAEAEEWGFAAVCVNGRYVRLASELLAGSGVRVGTVAGFPIGAMDEQMKQSEALQAMMAGAKDVDYVAHIPTLMDCDKAKIAEQFKAYVDVLRSADEDVCVKVILETALLMKDVDVAEGERRIAVSCDAAIDAGVDFVKSSTGFHPAGSATIEAVKLLKRYAGPMKVKASGGIKTYEQTMAMIAAGADRIGGSSGVAIMQGGGDMDADY